jgi:ribonuclease J
VRLIFLGGVAEVGKNLLVLEHDDDIIVIDCGIGFPDEHQPGVELILPDISYLRERAASIRGIFITHGHEDHIGGLPYLWPELRAPVYASPLTVGLIQVKLAEHNLTKQVELNGFDPDTRPAIRAGCFTLEPFRVCHSIPDAVGFAITTPGGLVVVTGDFKFDPSPADGKLTDYGRLAEFGERGVRLLISDCVHVEYSGRTPSETVVGETFESVFAEADGRIVVATFASLVSRIQQIVDTAARYRRSVVLLGRSLVRNTQVARDLGYLRDPEGVIIDRRYAADLPDDKIVYVVTGSQGEPMAVLARIASGEHREVVIGPGDTVVVSASPIPGNETAVFRIINQLFRRGANVLYGGRAKVHVSGHASQDDLRDMIRLTRPANIIPTHGEPRHLVLYAELAASEGYSPESITFSDQGDVIEFTRDEIEVVDHVDLEEVLLDTGRLATVTAEVVSDRRLLGQDGVIVTTLAISSATRTLLAGPILETRGFVDPNGSTGLLAKLQDRAIDAALTELDTFAGEDSAVAQAVKRAIRRAIGSTVHRDTRRKPVLQITVLDTDTPVEL